MTEEKWFMACRQAKFIFYCHCVISSIWNIAFSTSSVLGKKIPRGALFAWLHAQNVYLGTTLIVTKTRPRSNYFSLSSLPFLTITNENGLTVHLNVLDYLRLKSKMLPPSALLNQLLYESWIFMSEFSKMGNQLIPLFSLVVVVGRALEGPVQAFKSSSLNHQVF